MSIRNTKEQANNTQRLSERLIKRVKWIHKFNTKQDDELYLQQKIYFGKKLIDFLDKFNQEDYISHGTISKMIQRMNSMQNTQTDKFYCQVHDFLIGLMKNQMSADNFSLEEFDFFNKKVNN